MAMAYDFCGYATRANRKCSDGRVIMPDAFIDNDGGTVPLVWNHQHNDHFNVLGHALLQNRPDGVYAYCTFNDTESGQNARMLVNNGDIRSLSIYANQLKHSGPNVTHGMIREVSLVLAGANPGACIENVIQHGEMSEDSAIAFFDEAIELYHGDEGYDEYDGEYEEYEEYPEEDYEDDSNDNRTIADVFDEMDDEQKATVYAIVGDVLSEDGDEDFSHSEQFYDEGDDMDEERTIGDVFDEMTDEQKTVVYALVGEALAGDDDDEYDEEYEYDEEGMPMKHNVFDTDEEYGEDYITHSEMMDVIGDAKFFGSMRESALAHGITNIDYLFPDAKTLQDRPDFIARPMDWVNKVMGATRHSPFARIKSIFANITADEARAKGYIKGNQKVDEVFTLLKRTTLPQTIYKKQKLDRDDVIDITDFDVVAWLKTEMRMMLDEEIARAILIGDGRNASSDDKINPQNIRPIWTDDDLYTIKEDIDTTATTSDAIAKSFIKTAIKARKDYRGSGEPTLYTYEDMLTDMLLIEDTTGRVIYENVDKLARTLRVKEIVTVPVMDNSMTRSSGSGSTAHTHKLLGLIVNLSDYNVGADKGGAVNLFDDFDIDYNAQKYLIETRCSGAMIKPYGAIAIEQQTA